MFNLLRKSVIARICFSTKIQIPKRIPREPTDILRALESTITRDPTASHFKYHDDPYLIPNSNLGKRTFAMAQEAGRKAAFWIRQEHADLFQHQEADPPIEAFLPKMVYTENTEVSEDDLKKTIKNALVADSMMVYKLLKDQKKEVSEELTLSLLELVCYANCEDVLSEEFIEERWFRQSSRSKERQRKTWKDGSFAEELFISIETPNSLVYSALIQGMAKHFQVDRAWQLFEEAQQKNLVLNTETYNSIIKVANFLKEGYEMRWEFVLNMLVNMKTANVKPNLGTMNAVLYTLSTMGIGKFTKECVFKTLTEFKRLGIEPSLASWYYVLITFCKERGPTSTILNDIMNHIENKEHEIKDLNDTSFFVTAMDVCRNHLNDVALAKTVDALLHFGNNYDLIGDSYKESIYYRHYFVLFSNNLPLDEFMSTVYNKLVPNIYVPEPGVMEEVVKQVDLNAAIDYVPKLWSDIIIFDQTKRESLVNLVLDTMLHNTPPENSPLHENFSNISWDIYERIEGQREDRVNKLVFTGELLGKLMCLLLKAGNFGRACIVMDKLDKQHSNIVGVPALEALSLFVDACIVEKMPSRAIDCIQYCSDSGYSEAASLAAKLNDGLTLDENHLSKLSKIVGNVAISSKEK